MILYFLFFPIYIYIYKQKPTKQAWHAWSREFVCLLHWISKKNMTTAPYPKPFDDLLCPSLWFSRLPQMSDRWSSLLIDDTQDPFATSKVLKVSSNRFSLKLLSPHERKGGRGRGWPPLYSFLWFPA